MIPQVFDGDFLEGDLQTLQGNPSTTHDVHLINAFLDQIAESEEIPWKLLRHDDVHYSPFFNCKAITCFQKDGYNIYRIHPLDTAATSELIKYRILYAYDAPKNNLHFLAVVVKKLNSRKTTPNLHSYNYEHDHPISIRLRREYDDRGFARI